MCISSMEPIPLDPAVQSTLERLEEFGAQVQVIRRNGQITAFDQHKIAAAMTKAFLAVAGKSASVSQRIQERVDQLSAQVTEALLVQLPEGGTLHIEEIQDQVELSLMRAGEHQVARAYVLYREQRARLRQATDQQAPALQVIGEDGQRQPLDLHQLERLVREACQGLEAVSAEQVLKDSLRHLFDGVQESEVRQALVMSARTRIEQEPQYSQVAARLLLDSLRREALNFLAPAWSVETQADLAAHYEDYFHRYIHRGVQLELLDPRLAQFDLNRLGAALKAQRDFQFTYLGLQTLYDRYFIHTADGTRFELPQAFFMRVAMGLALFEQDREERAMEFYELLSRFDFMSSTPTLFNSGTLRPQLSSCYLTTVPDDLKGIYDAIKDNALLSKFAGGLGNDWTQVRGMGAHIKGTNGKSQGVVPFLKVANDTAVAVNQCFAGDTLVHSADGIKPIREIREGDLVLAQRGRYREVRKCMAYNQTDPMVEIRIKHAIAPLKVTAGHPLWAIRGIPLEQANARSYAWLEKGKVKPEWIEAGQLRKGDYVAQVIPQETIPVPGFGEEDARLYGILLGDGHCTKDGLEWGVSGNPEKDAHLAFVRRYLEKRGIHYWIKNVRPNYMQIGWATGVGVAREATTGRLIRGSQRGFLFECEALYDAQGNKCIHRKYAHLPPSQTLALLQGLIETNGGISRGKEIDFTTTSQSLAEGVRYQLLRLGVPCAGQYRAREQNHLGTRADSDKIRFQGTCKAYELRIPAVQALAERLGCQAIHKQNWLTWKNWLFTRVRDVREIEPVPFVFDLKVEGDESYMTTSALAHNGGKRKGAVCAYLETWHIDIEEFLELRKNTGDERRRTHDMNTANWVPDLFMKRLAEESHWTLFSPDETPDLHELTGQAFERAYVAYEEKAARGEIKIHKRVQAVELWRKMLNLLFETGHPWLTFKDPCNLRYTNQHVGVVHSSNLCTEITLHTNQEEIAVCNLGSVNLVNHLDEQGIDRQKLRRTVRTAMRMLDNVIDYNFYNVPQAKNANLRHRPVGLGLMGFQDALYRLGIPYASMDAVEFADRSMECLSYEAISASADLAEERGPYPSFVGSLWSQGILPIDSVELLEQERGGYLKLDRSRTLDWDALRERVQRVGMRNSNCMAIAPTATISNLTGVSQSIEPTYQNLFVKSNLSGEFTIVNPYLVADLKKLGLWDQTMVEDLKYYDGSVQQIDRIPPHLKARYATAFEIDPRWLVEAAARRQKWIDQAQSLNLYMREPSGKKLDQLYKLAWVRGLKTTYYLRSMGATHVEKTLDPQRRQRGGGSGSSRGLGLEQAQACSILDPECEACQ